MYTLFGINKPKLIIPTLNDEIHVYGTNTQIKNLLKYAYELNDGDDDENDENGKNNKYKEFNMDVMLSKPITKVCPYGYKHKSLPNKDINYIGITFIEDTAKGPCLLLFRSSYNGMYSILYGNTKQDSSDIDSLKLHTIQKSYHMFDITDIQNIDDIKHIDHNKFRCYCAYIKSKFDYVSIYNHNQNIVNKTRSPKEWKTTNGIAKIYVFDLLNIVSNSDNTIKAYDTEKKSITIDSMTSNLLYYLLKPKLLENILSKQYNITALMQLQNIAFLKNTITLKLS